MASQMMEALMELCQEKHIDQLYLIDRLEESLAKSYTDILHLPFGAEVTIDRATGKVYVYELVPVESSYNEETDEYAEFEKRDVTPKDTSRIAAKHAKDEINAIVRNSAREQIYEEFSDRIGDIITGTVLQSTPDFTIVKIREGVEAELPHFDQRRYHDEDGNPTERNERPAGERYLHNQRIKAVIIDVRDPNNTVAPVRGEHSRPPIVISRTHPALIRRLFERTPALSYRFIHFSLRRLRNAVPLVRLWTDVLLQLCAASIGCWPSAVSIFRIRGAHHERNSSHHRRRLRRSRQLRNPRLRRLLGHVVRALPHARPAP